MRTRIRTRLIATLALAACLLGARSAQAKVYAALKDASTLSYNLVHKTHDITGVSKNFLCTVDLAADSSKSRILVKAAVATFNSGNSNRDANMMEVVEATKYPFVQFMSDSVRREGRDWRVFGVLTFHGVKRPLDFKVTPEASGGKIRIKGAFKVSLTEFKVQRPRLLMIPVEDDLEIRLDVVAKTD